MSLPTSIPEIPKDGKSVAFKRWRPYSTTDSSLTNITNIALASTGLYVSSSNPTMGLLLAAAAGASAFSCWRDNKRNNKHESMMVDLVSHAFNQFDQPNQLENFTALTEYYMSRKDFRLWISQIINNGEKETIINKDGKLEHRLSWKVPTEINESVILSVIIGLINTSMYHVGKLGLTNLEAYKLYDRTNSGEISGYKLIIIQDVNENDDLFIPIFINNLKFHLNNADLFPDDYIKPSAKPISTLKQNKIENVIKGAGNWKLDDGHILEIKKTSPATNNFEVTLYEPKTGSRGMSIEHKSLESINKTWGHLIPNTDNEGPSF